MPGTDLGRRNEGEIFKAKTFLGLEHCGMEKTWNQVVILNERLNSASETISKHRRCGPDVSSSRDKNKPFRVSVFLCSQLKFWRKLDAGKKAK